MPTLSKKLNITQEMINDILRVNLVNTSGGLLVQKDREYPVRVFVTPDDLQELQNLPLKTEDNTVCKTGGDCFVRTRRKA